MIGVQWRWCDYGESNGIGDGDGDGDGGPRGDARGDGAGDGDEDDEDGDGGKARIYLRWTAGPRMQNVNF